MAKITQYSRISHHTITGTSSNYATFSVPSSEDFTDGTWTVTDLAISEIGINEYDYKAYIRINDTIKEFAWSGSTSSTALFWDVRDLVTDLAITTYTACLTIPITTTGTYMITGQA